MINLEAYKVRFDTEFANYSDVRYGKICGLVEGLPSDLDVQNNLNTPQAIAIEAMLGPLIEIRNYKSQTPFTRSPFEAVKLIARLKKIQDPWKFDNEAESAFNSFLELGGFRLPTISAIFHFCHCNHFPIVDRNIAAACADFAEDVSQVAPKIPSYQTKDSSKNIEAYKQFVSFLGKLKEMHNLIHKTDYSFRDLDKSLMVYGAEKLKNKKTTAKPAV